MKKHLLKYNNVYYLPISTGRNSLYITCWYIAISIFLASWYNFSSIHEGFNFCSSLHNTLCSRINEVVVAAKSGCWLTLISP